MDSCSDSNRLTVDVVIPSSNRSTSMQLTTCTNRTNLSLGFLDNSCSYTCNVDGYFILAWNFYDYA